MTGRIHSYQTLGAVDGPGLRFVVFFQGCPLRCGYCHNPDSWNFNAGDEYTVKDLTEKILRFKPYFKSSGGVTLSGGEVLSQPDFAAKLLKELKTNNIHTAIDTSGICDKKAAIKVLKYCDLVICDIKFNNEELYKKYTGGSLNNVLSFLRLTEQMGIPIWIRNVVIPNINDEDRHAYELIEIAKSFNSLEKIEFLPFRKICTVKYEQLGIDFPFNKYDELTKEKILSLKRLIPEKYR